MSRPAALLVVRAVVADPADREPFDRWYRDEHLPEARAAFAARRAWRGWSRREPSVHWAFYEFATLEAADAVPGSPALAALIEAFDRRWAGRVTRTRDLVAAEQWLEAGPPEGSA
jgi:hypothetical protein